MTMKTMHAFRNWRGGGSWNDRRHTNLSRSQCGGSLCHRDLKNTVDTRYWVLYRLRSPNLINSPSTKSFVTFEKEEPWTLKISRLWIHWNQFTTQQSSMNKDNDTKISTRNSKIYTLLPRNISSALQVE